jgi:two-component system phosphate regulon sensor histidine kinase PhoR
VLKATAFPARLGAEGASGACLVIRDITQMKRLETVRQQFVANASHELRTPLSAIRIIAESLQDGALDDPEAALGFVEDILANTDRLAKLVDDMMELARLEALKEELELIELSYLVSLCIERMTPLATERGVELVLSGDLNRLALGNARNLESALVNLLDNAIKYAASGKRVELRLVEDGETVRIELIDYGPGIPLEERNRVFERFWRVDKARSREIGGTGLGLSIVKHAVENMGGRVWVEATPGGGATFAVALKLAEVPAEEVEESALF